MTTELKNNRRMTYNIQGMTCGSCVNTIQSRLMTLTGVASAKVSLIDKNVEISADRIISLEDVQKSFVDLPKYSFSNNITRPVQPPKSYFKTYKPLFIIFSFILLTSTAYQFSLSDFHFHVFMNHIMAGFFIGLSFFKFLDLQAFAESFSNYDPLAKRFSNYGFIYPFIELTLGLSFISGLWLMQAQILTIILLSITTIGVWQKLQRKSQFECACLGTAFSLPLSNLTIAENAVMIVMSLYGVLMT